MHINVSRLIFDVENESSTVQGGENRKEREKGKKVGGWMLRLAQGVCVQEALGVRDLQAVPARVRGRADQDPVSDDDGRASGPDDLGFVRVPRALPQRLEGDRVVPRQPA